MTTSSQTPIRLVVTLAIALLPLAGCASSQDAARDEDRITQQLASMDAALDLTDGQAAQIREILVAADADRPSGPPPRGRQAGGDDPRAEIEARRAKTDKLIEDTLTKKQIERYRAWRASEPEPQLQRGAGPPPRGQ